MGGGRGCGACGGTDRWLTWFKLLLFYSCDDSGVAGMTTTWGVAADVGASAGANIASAAGAGANVSTPAGADIVAGDMLSHVIAGAEVATGAGADIAADTGADIVAGAGGGDALSCP